MDKEWEQALRRVREGVKPPPEWPKDRFLRVAESLFYAGCDRVEATGGGYPGVPPQVIPFSNSEDGELIPGELLSFMHSDEGGANRLAINEIEKHGGQWSGYLYLRHAVITAGGTEMNGILLEGWLGTEVCTHMARRYRAFPDRTVEFIEPPTRVSAAAPNRLLVMKHETAPDGRARWHAAIAAGMERASKLEGSVSSELKGKLSVPEPGLSILVSDHDRRWVIQTLARLDSLFEMEAPPIIIDGTLEKLIDRLNGLGHHGC